MHLSSISSLIVPLIREGKKWQYIDLDGDENPPKYKFSSTQIIFILLGLIITIGISLGVSKDLIGYIISAFSISVSLFMSLLVNIFDKFEKTSFDTTGKSDVEKVRLLQKRHFFKKFISITSYLVVMSILIIILCSLNYLYCSTGFAIKLQNLVFDFKKIDWIFTLKNFVVIFYRVSLLYFILNYLLLTLFIAGSSFEYYISELNKVQIKM